MQADEAKFFTENRQKIVEELPINDNQQNPQLKTGDIVIQQSLQTGNVGNVSASNAMGGRGRDDGNYYITSINAKRNPDLIIPGGAIKGNMYFRRHIDPEKGDND